MVDVAIKQTQMLPIVIIVYIVYRERCVRSEPVSYFLSPSHNVGKNHTIQYVSRAFLSKH